MSSHNETDIINQRRMAAVHLAWKSVRNICRPSKWNIVVIPMIFATIPAIRTRKCAIWISNVVCTRIATVTRNRRWAIWLWRDVRPHRKCYSPGHLRSDVGHIWIRRSARAIAQPIKMETEVAKRNRNIHRIVLIAITMATKNRRHPITDGRHQTNCSRTIRTSLAQHSP